MSNIPPQKSEKSFRRYEPTIINALACYPDVYLVYPKDIISIPISLNTHTARLRDALLSWRENGWKWSREGVDTTNLKRLVVSTYQNNIVIGSLDAIKLYKQMGDAHAKDVGLTLKDEIVDLPDSKIELDTLFTLAVLKLIKFPVRFKYDLSNLFKIAENYDLAITSEDDTHTLYP